MRWSHYAGAEGGASASSSARVFWSVHQLRVCLTRRPSAKVACSRLALRGNRWERHFMSKTVRNGRVFPLFARRTRKDSEREARAPRLNAVTFRSSTFAGLRCSSARAPVPSHTGPKSSMAAAACVMSLMQLCTITRVHEYTRNNSRAHDTIKRYTNARPLRRHDHETQERTLVWRLTRFDMFAL